MQIEYKINGNTVTAKEFQERTDPSKLQEMLETREFGGMMTDDVFLSGLPQVQHMPSRPEFKQLLQNAMKHGYRPKPTDVYQPALARFRGDPRAFVNHGQARGHIAAICDAEGRGCEGAVNRSPREPEVDPWEKPKYKLSPKLVREMVRKKVAKDPDLARMDRRELIEKVVSEHSRKE